MTPNDVVQALRQKAAPAPAAAAPVETPRSIYTTPARREEIATQEATPEIEAANRQTLATELAKPRADRRPIQVGYNSAKADEARTDGPLKLNEPQRAEQRALADEGEANGIGDQFREVYDKVTIPYKAQDTKKGGTTLFAFSLDKVIRNIDMLGAWLRRNPNAAASLAQTTGVQSLESPEFRAQFQNYLQNQANGYRGDGKPLVKTEDTRAEDIPDPTPGYTPVPVPEGASRLINSLMGLRNAIDYGEGASASQSFVQRLAKANGAAVVETRQVPGRKAGETVPANEFNLVNKELRNLGFDTNLFHVAIEQLRLNRIATPITFREDLNVRAPVQGTIQIGFMPAPAPNTPEFKRWFGDSKVVDESGNPLPLYHGTTRDIGPIFKAGKEGGSLGNGIYFTPDPEVAENYAINRNDVGYYPGSNISKVYVSLKNPLILETPFGEDPMVQAFRILGMSDDKIKAFLDKQYSEKGYVYNQLRNRATKAGYDGIMQFRVFGGEKTVAEVVAFKPEQVKSATGNTGAYSPTSRDIRFMPAGGLTPGQPAATTPANEIPSRRPVQRRFLFEPDTGGAAEFRSALIAAAANHPAGKAVTIKDLADYEQAKLFLDEAKTAGLAITPEGDLISVFKAKGSTTDINDILAEAAPEAITLDAYASGKGYLPNLYAKHGFRPVARVEFDRNFAPEGWPYERLGTPDVVLMVNDPTGLSGLPRLDNDYVSKKEEIPLVSYDEALRLQREAVDLIERTPEPGMTAVREENANYFAPPTDEDARNALYETKRADYGAARSLPEGYPVELRIDIPAFKQTGNYVVTVHEKGEKSRVGTVIGYDNVAAVDNAVFSNKSEKVSQQIRDGVRNKTPLAVVSGEFNPSREMPADIESWTPVGFDPVKHSYFYDKTSGRPVVEAEKAISVGNTVFALNPTYAPRYKFQYMAAEPTGTPGVTELNTEVSVPSDTRMFNKIVKEIQKDAPTMAKVLSKVKESDEYKEGMGKTINLPPLDEKRLKKEKRLEESLTTEEVLRRARARYKAAGGEFTATRFSLLNTSSTKRSLAQNILETDPNSLFDRLDSAKQMLDSDPARMASVKGYGEYMKSVGLSGDVMSATPMIDTILNRPAEYASFLRGGYHGDRTKPGTLEAADVGLDATVRMRQAINGRPPELVTALHSLWGILSRRLAPIQQEAMWLRLISSPEVMAQLQNSVDGNFNQTAEEWEALVSKTKRETDYFSDKLGSGAVSNANDFYLMLSALNGKWNMMSDVYAAPNSTEMGRRFWSLGLGKLGIRNKVQRFIGLTFGIPALIMDRWKFVEFYFQQFGKSPQDYFVYDSGNTPEDPNGIYAFYGPFEGASDPLSLAFYEGLENVLNTAIANSSELRDVLGRHANLGGMHWKAWNAIKNEAVGHSSLDLTYDLVLKNPNPTAQDVLDLTKTKEYYTEGLVGTKIKRFTLPRNR